jgi:hypothetical protein
MSGEWSTAGHHRRFKSHHAGAANVSSIAIVSTLRVGIFIRFFSLIERRVVQGVLTPAASLLFTGGGSAVSSELEPLVQRGRMIHLNDRS